MILYLSISRARHQVKRLLGNANHQIITALIGLDAIEKGIVTAKPEGFDTIWAPRDPSASAIRSRALILEMALVRCVDALDTYIRLSIRQPALVQSSELRKDIAGCGHSVFAKCEAIEQHIDYGDELLSSLVALIITWRNRQVHTDADDTLSPDCKNIICDRADEAMARFRGLNVDTMLHRYENNKSPSFKEIASFVKVTLDYVIIVEEYLFAELNNERFLRELVWNGLLEGYEGNSRRQEHRKSYSKRVWGKSGTNKQQAVERFLQRNGLSRTKPDQTRRYVVFDDGALITLVSKSPKEILDWASAAGHEKPS